MASLFEAIAAAKGAKVGLLGDIGKKLLKVIDNPITRAGLGTVGLSGAGAILSAAAGNQAAANAQLGAAYGSIYQGGQAATPVFNPQITGAPMLLGNLFPSIPGVSGAQPTITGVAKAAYKGASQYVYGAPTTKRRRMNPANIKAARRAIRRIRSTRRVLQRIERLLPTRTVHARRK